jgi:hypothetical protein
MLEENGPCDFLIVLIVIRVPKESSHSWGPNYGTVAPNSLTGKMPIKANHFLSTLPLLLNNMWLESIDLRDKLYLLLLFWFILWSKRLQTPLCQMSRVLTSPLDCNSFLGFDPVNGQRPSELLCICISRDNPVQSGGNCISILCLLLVSCVLL